MTNWLTYWLTKGNCNTPNFISNEIGIKNTKPSIWEGLNWPYVASGQGRDLPMCDVMNGVNTTCNMDLVTKSIRLPNIASCQSAWYWVDTMSADLQLIFTMHAKNPGHRNIALLLSHNFLWEEGCIGRLFLVDLWELKKSKVAISLQNALDLPKTQRDISL